MTHPLRFSGARLVINFATAAGGSVKTEVQAADGTPIDGFREEDCIESIGDELARVVQWKGGRSVGNLRDQPAKLRFTMRDADLYSLRFL